MWIAVDSGLVAVHEPFPMPYNPFHDRGSFLPPLLVIALVLLVICAREAWAFVRVWW